jgi:hypothetical protein
VNGESTVAQDVRGDLAGGNQLAIARGHHD